MKNLNVTCNREYRNVYVFDKVDCAKIFVLVIKNSIELSVRVLG